MSPLPGGPGRVPPGDAPPPPAGDPSKRTVARDSEADGPEPKEELTAPKLPRASAGRVQGTAHLRTDGPPRGPVVTRPPQRRRSDSRIRKAVEPPIAPSPPAAPPPSASPRSPRVVGSSTRHKAVKGPGRGPGGGTG
ncbi:MAG: hypothetical protein FJ086_13305 [Deltaproteobacteria bacterium]|nr:hypothetical protein [Deltaproteobacteria bacterium]